MLVATKNSWKTKPFPSEFKIFKFQKAYPIEKLNLITRGLIPQDRRDRWFVYYDNSWLYIHHAWMKNCIYKIEIELSSDQILLKTIYLNQNVKQYRNYDTNTKLDIFILDTILYGWIELNQTKENSNYIFTRQKAQKLDTSCTTLAELGESEDYITRQNVASNPNTPLEVLIRLSLQFPKEVSSNPIILLSLTENQKFFIFLSCPKNMDFEWIKELVYSKGHLLNWTKHQVRYFIKKTYNKANISHLTDDQLYDFTTLALYLEDIFDPHHNQGY